MKFDDMVLESTFYRQPSVWKTKADFMEKHKNDWPADHLLTYNECDDTNGEHRIAFGAAWFKDTKDIECFRGHSNSYLSGVRVSPEDIEAIAVKADADATEVPCANMGWDEKKVGSRIDVIALLAPPAQPGLQRFVHAFRVELHTSTGSVVDHFAVPADVHRS